MCAEMAAECGVHRLTFSCLRRFWERGDCTQCHACVRVERVHAFLVQKLLPLYALICIGYLAGRRLDIQTQTVARILIFLFIPVLVFHGAYTAPLDFHVAALPLGTFIISCSICAAFWRISGRWFHDEARNILTYSAGTGNTGYFGIPVMTALFGDAILPTLILCIVGISLFENSVGYYITARGRHTVQESIAHTLRLPALYAFFLGLIAHAAGVPLGVAYQDLVQRTLGGYSLLGMLLVGFGLSQVARLRFDFRFMGVAMAARYIVWPLVTWALVWPAASMGFIDTALARELSVFAFVPIAANMVAFAAQFNIYPDKAAVTVVTSTFLSLFLIPLAKWLLG